ncbi:MAG: preprotein translocase subunit YajC [Sedimentisphaerales bacterium]|nr:preprotein translocase subunit YajC [Sedimentisphaerales bacterium]
MKKMLLATAVLVFVLSYVSWAQDGAAVDPCGAVVGSEEVVDPCSMVEGGEQGGGIPTWVPLVLMFVVLYFFMFRGPKKRQQQHQQMMAAMKKGDRVRTIGGIIGTIADVRDDEVVVKIDESTNTKMRFARSAISRIMTEDEEKSN